MSYIPMCVNPKVKIISHVKNVKAVFIVKGSETKLRISKRGSGHWKPGEWVIEILKKNGTADMRFDEVEYMASCLNQYELPVWLQGPLKKKGWVIEDD